MRTKFLFHTLSNFLMITGFGTIVFTYFPIAYSEVEYFFKPQTDSEYIIVSETQKKSLNEGFEFENVIPITPIDNNFSIIITKIGVNAPVVENVSMVSNSEYMKALRNGVAHAVGTALPGKDGNMFLFAHSSLNFWRLGKYATVFNLLNKLKKGDSVILYYKGVPYVYKVFDVRIVKGWNTRPFDEEYDLPVLTMVTCYPPGTTMDRLVVKAKMNL